MSIFDLKKALNEGVVIFQFVKKDGTLRHARGTTDPDLVPTGDMPITHHPSPITRHPSPITRNPSPITRHPSPITHNRSTIAFYDIDKKGWRSMRIDTIWSYKRALRLT